MRIKKQRVKVRIPLPKQKPKVVPNRKKGGKLKYNRIPEDWWFDLRSDTE